MLLIKLTAEDLRLIDRAGSPAELAGCVSLVKERIQQAQVLKSFGRTPGPNRADGSRIRWDAAWRICQEVLGDQVYRPPAPEYRWFQRIATSIRVHEMDEEYVRILATYVKEHIPGKNAFHFIMTQSDRILAGEYDREAKDSPSVKLRPPLESLQECRLPELGE